MAKEGGFFSGSAKKDKRIAGDYSIEDKKNVQGVTIKLQKNPNYQPKSYELDSLYRQRKADNKPFFSPSGNEVGQIASATTDLSGLISNLPSDYKETEQNVIQINDEGEDIEKENIESVSKDKLITSEPDKQQQIIDRRKAMLNKKRELGISNWGHGSYDFESNKEEV